MHASLRQKELVIQEKDAQIQQLSTQLREKDERSEAQLQQKDDIIQRKNADISTLQREVQRLQVSNTLQEPLKLLERTTPLKVSILLWFLPENK